MHMFSMNKRPAMVDHPIWKTHRPNQSPWSVHLLKNPWFCDRDHCNGPPVSFLTQWLLIWMGSHTLGGATSSCTMNIMINNMYSLSLFKCLNIYTCKYQQIIVDKWLWMVNSTILRFNYQYPQFHPQVIAKKTAFFLSFPPCFCQQFFPFVSSHLAQAKLIAHQCAKRWRGTKPRLRGRPRTPQPPPRGKYPLRNKVSLCPGVHVGFSWPGKTDRP